MKKKAIILEGMTVLVDCTDEEVKVMADQKADEAKKDEEKRDEGIHGVVAEFSEFMKAMPAGREKFHFMELLLLDRITQGLTAYRERKAEGSVEDLAAFLAGYLSATLVSRKPAGGHSFEIPDNWKMELNKGVSLNE